MSYIVVYQQADGSSAVEECSDLDLAVVTAERLRNVDSIERPRIFKTEEISYDFRPYYRVEVVGASNDEDTPQAPAAAAPMIDDVPAPEPADVFEQVDEPVEVATETIATEPSPAPPTLETEPFEVDGDAEQIDGDSELGKQGLFNHAPEPPQEFPAVTQIIEEEDEVSPPPRRGLFGR